MKSRNDQIHSKMSRSAIGPVTVFALSLFLGACETMDETDRMRTAMVLNDSRTGETTSWVNPDTGRHYAVTPTRTYEQGPGPCREFRLDAAVGEQDHQHVYGTACLQADGSWLVQ